MVRAKFWRHHHRRISLACPDFYQIFFNRFYLNRPQRNKRETFLKINRAVYSLSFLLIIFSGFPHAAEKTASEILADNIRQIRTYQAEFEQQVANETGKVIDVSNGEFFIQRPNHFRWQVNQPFEQLIVADGDHIFTYDPDLLQVTIQNQSKLLADSPLLLFTSDAGELSRSFEISLLELTDKQQGQLFQLQPKGESGIFESVHILFEQRELRELLMTDSLGQQTSVKFSALKVNQKLDPALFSFVTPEGVDVIDSREWVKPKTDETD